MRLSENAEGYARFTASLGVLLVLYGYSAFAGGRQPKAISVASVGYRLDSAVTVVDALIKE